MRRRYGKRASQYDVSSTWSRHLKQWHGLIRTEAHFVTETKLTRNQAGIGRRRARCDINDYPLFCRLDCHRGSGVPVQRSISAQRRRMFNAKRFDNIISHTLATSPTPPPPLKRLTH